MKFLSVFVFSLLVLQGYCASTEFLPSSTNAASSTTTTIATTTTTTSPTTTTSTPASSTTTTTTTASTTTTAAQSTTTTTAATTTVPPTANPGEKNNQKGSWNVTGTNGTVCILLKAEIRLEIEYNKTEKDATSLTKVYFDVPANATASGFCGETNQNITLTFFEDWKLTLTFGADNKTYNMTEIELMFSADPKTFPNITGNFSGIVASMKNDTDELGNKVDLAKAFRCDSETEVDDFKTNTSLPAKLTKLTTWYIQVQAFVTNGKFGSFEACQADTKVNNLVPIIVGAALAGLVLIVLVAYLIGRRRNKRGYESV